ncbi:hypothetical protein Q8F55_006879 [Vanrija albida]|uniref:Translation initiation factor eIF2B subunit delta n=1 Tax=Vanrija albida TaxID=181172 RepID=A0ABR3PYS5_9TREE
MSSPTKQTPIKADPKSGTPTPKAAGGKDKPAAGAGKDKNAAKEAKKASRAAKVAARGGGDASAAASPASAVGASAAASPAVSAGPSAASGPSTAQHSGPSRHRRAIAAEAAASTASAPPNPTSTFFSHLPGPRAPDTPAALTSDKLHPTIVRLGVLIAAGTLRGASARTVGVLEAFREVVHDYQCPDTGVFWKDLNSHISPMIAYLETCRPKGVGVGNAIRWFKGEITRLGDEHAHMDEAAQKAALIDAIGVYLRDRIEVAGQVIADNAREKIKPDDTVVVYARSSVVELTLLEAWRELQAQSPPQSFNVTVVDSRPLHEGRALLAALTHAGIPCTYTLLPLASTALARADLVLLGASSLNSDGALHSRAGTAVVAMLAKEHRVPVVACVETFKLSERVQLDDLASNELGAAADLLSIPTAHNLEIAKPLAKQLTTLSLLYDLTPPQHITAVCTEVGFIPPSSVPTLLGKSSGAA